MIRRVVLIIAVVALAAAACGIPSDDEPRAIPDAALPEQAREPRTPSSPSSSVPAGTGQSARIYLVAGPAPQARLVSAEVVIDGPVDPAQLPQRVVEELIHTRPDEVGLAGAATNELPSDTQVLSAVKQPDGVLDLNLSKFGIEGAGVRLAMAQIVFTVTSLEGIIKVRFSFDGSPASVPTEAGNVTEPVGPEDYGALNPNQAQESIG